MSNLHKETKKGFVEVMTDLRNYINPKTQAKAPLISDTGMLRRWICKNGCGWFSRAVCRCLCLAGCLGLAGKARELWLTKAAA